MNTSPSDQIDLPPAELIDSLTFCIFDLETTGGNQQFDKVIEIGLVKMKGRKIVEELGLMIDPGIPIPEFIQRLTGLTSEKLKGRPPIENVIDQITTFMGDAILVAHNSGFDVPFFNSVLQRLGKETLKNKVLCTNLMTKYMIPEIMNSNLAYMGQIFGIPHHKAHRALEDARAAGMLLKTYLDIFVDKKVRKVNQLYYPRNKFELDRVHYKKQDGLAPVIEILNTLEVPLLLLAKGEQGIIKMVLPLAPGKIDVPTIENYLKELDFQMITFKLLGTYFQGLLELAQNYTKLSKEDVQWIIELMAKQMGLPPNEELEEKFVLEQSFLYQGDFLIVPHLIPEQMIVYPLTNLWPKKELVFRFPGHKKKMLQYLFSQVRRSSTQKKKFRPHFIPNELLPFIDAWIKSASRENWIFTGDMATKKPGEFHQLMTDFLGQNLPYQKYPRYHL